MGTDEHRIYDKENIQGVERSKLNNCLSASLPRTECPNKFRKFVRQPRVGRNQRRQIISDTNDRCADVHLPTSDLSALPSPSNNYSGIHAFTNQASTYLGPWKLSANPSMNACDYKTTRRSSSTSLSQGNNANGGPFQLLLPFLIPIPVYPPRIAARSGNQ
ncbi:unnamed protein product, partial [Protopolystoma xenopodis]